MAKTTYTATLPNGETVTRKTERTYTHVVVSEVTWDGETSFFGAEWAGRPDLAQKNAAKWERNWAKQLNVRHSYIGTLTAYTVHIIPVNA